MRKRKLIDGYPFVEYQRSLIPDEELIEKSRIFFHQMDQRRSIRDFSSRPVPREVIENLVCTASSAPSGAHKQPWTFCLVQDPEFKKAIREAAEKEEMESYQGRMTEEWLADLRPLQTNWEKPFLTTAPWLIVVFRKNIDIKPDGQKGRVYYSTESCGLACGFLLASIHQAGLAALTHTPSPMNFLSTLLGRPDHEKPFLLIPVGYPAEECWVPDLERKSLKEVAVWY